MREAEVEAVAVCLLFSFLHPEHERRVGEALREALPDVRVSLSSEVLPEVREYERFSTTVADAYLAPRLAPTSSALAERTERRRAARAAASCSPRAAWSISSDAADRAAALRALRAGGRRGGRRLRGAPRAATRTC